MIPKMSLYLIRKRILWVFDICLNLIHRSGTSISIKDKTANHIFPALYTLYKLTSIVSISDTDNYAIEQHTSVDIIFNFLFSAELYYLPYLWAITPPYHN